MVKSMYISYVLNTSEMDPFELKIDKMNQTLHKVIESYD